MVSRRSASRIAGPMNGTWVYTRGEQLADGGIHLIGMSAALIACTALVVVGHQSRSTLVSVVVG